VPKHYLPVNAPQFIDEVQKEHIMNNMIDSLRLLRRRLALVETRDRAIRGTQGSVSLGHEAIDHSLGGGLMRGRLHELLGAADDAGSASGFAAVLGRLIGGDMLWVVDEALWQREGRLYPAGLAAIGLDPARLIIVLLPDAVAVLRAAVDGLRCNALGSVVIALPGDPRALDLTASRRLALAAEAGGVTALMLRLGGKPLPSAAQSRWQVASAPSLPLAGASPGHPAWTLELLRQRGRPDGGCWCVEWDSEQVRLHDRDSASVTIADGAAIPGAVVPLSPGRPAARAGASRRIA
jgi:protein ImuA